MFQSMFQNDPSGKKNDHKLTQNVNNQTELSDLLKGHEMVGKMNSGPAQKMEVLRQVQQPVGQAQQAPGHAPRSLSLSKWTGSKGTSDSLPKDVLSKMENSFATSFADVKVHKNDSSATQMGALAYTQGNEVHFAPGQYNPNSQAGKELLGHELTHVVQQREGRVQPTKQGKGISVNDNPNLENEADVIGRKVAEGKVVRNQLSHDSTRKNINGTAQYKSAVIQRAVNTWGGTWDTDKYDLIRDKNAYGTTYPSSVGVRGVEMNLKFTPGINADAELIGLTQSVHGVVNKKHLLSPAARTRYIKSTEAINADSGESDHGTAIDRASGYNNPIYPVASKPSASLNDNNTHAGWGQNGWRYKDNSGSINQKDAKLIDSPSRPGAAKDSHHIFETAAVATKGTHAGLYYGSVRWGWRTDGAGNFSKLPLQVVSKGIPSSTFMKAAEIWNKSNGGTNVNLPIVDVKTVKNKSITLTSLTSSGKTTLPVGTRVQITNPYRPSLLFGEIKVVDGPHTGMVGKVASSDWNNIVDERI